ncbi:MAG: prepilin-type N-terminal cleavage/methylation domain-containing protein [Desulfuromonadales bacterium]|nr:prepilin-type N-terminal cleavage/methylation domain-containing protein [Desulfuromonadales bacterium]
MLCRDFKICPGMHRVTRQDGVTLLELIVVVAVFGVLASIAFLGLDGWHRSRLVAATGTLLADLQTTRMNAMTESSDDDSRGFGLRFLDNQSYKVFEFVDNGVTDFTYEGAAEEVGGYDTEVGNGITITLEESGNPAGVTNALLYDKRGMSRTPNWSSVAGRSYVLRHSSLNQARCIAISQVRIREGIWNSSASPKCQVR